MIEVLEIRCGGERLAVPLSRVVEIAPRVLVTALPDVAPPVVGCIDYRGQAIAAVDLAQRLGQPARAPELGDHFVIARTQQRPVALVVERALGTSRVDPDDVAAAPASAELVAGVARLGGGLLLIVDLDGLLSLEAERQLDAALAEVPPP